MLTLSLTFFGMLQWKRHCFLSIVHITGILFTASILFCFPIIQNIKSAFYSYQSMEMY